MTTSAPVASGYALDPAWHAERARLTGLTDLYDPATQRLCELVGLAAGWHCLEVGAGTGTVAQYLADRVGPTGRVLALDTDTRFLDAIATDVLRVQQADVTADPLPSAAFDLIHARLLLEHLPAREQVLHALVRALRPGGWLLIEDFDWATATVIDPPDPVHDRVVHACLRLLGQLGYDPHFARTLPRRLGEAGLREVSTHAAAAQVRADTEYGLPQWELLVDQLTPLLLGRGLLTQDDLDAFGRLWHDGRTVCFAPLMVSCWGRAG